MSRTIDGKKQNHSVDDASRYSLLRGNSKALLALFVIAVYGSAIAFRGHIVALIQGTSVFGYDFIDLYRVAHVFLNGGNVYRTPPGAAAYAYPPPTIYLFVPFAYLSFEQARIAMTAISVTALLFSVYFITKILYHYGTHLSKLEIVLIGAALFLFEPIVLNLYAVNINLSLLFLITAFYYLFFVQKRAAGAGIVLGIAAILKIFPLVFILLDFLHKSKKMLVAAVATAATISLCVLRLQGTSVWLEWFNAIRDFESWMFVVSKDAVLAPLALDPNVSLTTAIIKVIVLFDLNVEMAIPILNIAKIVFILGIFSFLFKTSKSKKDGTKLKEWEILSFTLLLVSVLFVATNVTWTYYTSYLVLSFILMVFVIPLSFIEKIVLIVILGLFSTCVEITDLCWRMIGGTAKTIVYIIPPGTVAYILFITLIIYVIRDRTKSNYWTLPLLPEKDS